MSRQFNRSLSSSRTFRVAASFDRLFLGLLDVLASLNLLSVVLFPAGLGALFVIGGCVYEQSAQAHMLHGGGLAALDAYLALVQSHQLSLGEFLVASVTGHCYAVSAVWQGIGFWLVFVVAPLCMVFTVLARIEVRFAGRRAVAVVDGRRAEVVFP
ncbi:hypothetical protein [Paraburkholderia fungorum]|uniref:RDD domain-containing protein n=1 Tax=Paraburkholderia fungorum TaxID=134537 RepID=A0AAW3V1X1_9BURK|nr:hypothetical protein [Paraburkholderia fungorum]MBB4517430.1 hypothetical protein [Paraburkholderia fungorum]MBB6204498.1 hypothetical protein [Paraburkholderia fungorum]